VTNAPNSDEFSVAADMTAMLKRVASARPLTGFVGVGIAGIA
jgi:hypothetical protein